MEEQKDRFLSLYRELICRDGADALLHWLQGSDFFTAPASTRFHGACEGGLLEHALCVYDCLTQEIAVAGLAETYSRESTAIVSLLHDLCKVNMYQTELKNRKTYAPEIVAAAPNYQVKHDANGDYVWEQYQGYTINDELPYGHGEKSVYIISGFLKLTREEAMAIRWHMGFSDNDFRAGSQSVGKAFERYPLALLTHVADLKATYLYGK